MQLFNLMTGAMVVIAGGLMAYKAHRAIALYWQALAWPTVAGVVVGSELRERTDSEGTSYHAEIACTYQVDGRDHTTTRHTGGVRFSEHERSMQALVAAYPVGRVVDIRVPPSRAADGMLVIGEPHHMVVIRRVGWVVVLLGVLLALHGLLASA